MIQLSFPRPVTELVATLGRALDVPRLTGYTDSAAPLDRLVELQGRFGICSIGAVGPSVTQSRRK